MVRILLRDTILQLYKKSLNELHSMVQWHNGCFGIVILVKEETQRQSIHKEN